MFLANVYVTLKPVVNDPEGLTIASGLRSLGFTDVENVRSGKFLQVKLNGTDRAAAEAAVHDMCRRLLANPVIEDYRFEIEQL